ncbi:MAG: hypothetical protein WBA39_16345 [Rivularia sp. (in: cyanobacteria)]
MLRNRSDFIRYFFAPVSVALIAATATLGTAIIQNLDKSKPTSQEETITCQKTCVEHVTLQVNNDTPKQFRHKERVPLKTKDKLRIVEIKYFIPPKAIFNSLKLKPYFLTNSVDSSTVNIDELPTSSDFPISQGSHSVRNFENNWQIQPGQHRIAVHIIQYDGSNKIVNKDFYLNIDIGP